MKPFRFENAFVAELHYEAEDGVAIPKPLFFVTVAC